MVSLKHTVITSAILALASGQGVILKAQGNKGSPASLGLQGMSLIRGDPRRSPNRIFREVGF